MLSQTKEFEQAIFKYSASSPAYQYEGVAGYIETIVTFEIRDLEKFSNLYNQYNKLPNRDIWYYNICKQADIR